MKGFKAGITGVGHTIAGLINTALLFVVYVVGVGLTSIIAKIFRKHFLHMKLSKKRESYWTELNLKKRPIEHYYRQF